jgi:hypothetical protein
LNRVVLVDERDRTKLILEVECEVVVVVVKC